jgi:SAM-dependent methyltransferase
VKVFDAYAEYYDLLYGDKDYSAEAAYVSRLLRARGGNKNRVLELGCGTGGHALEFARLGYQITGVDLSERMLEGARDRCSQVGGRFVHGDVRNLRLSERFDCVLSLFHVASYQTSNADIEGMLRTAAVHLEPGGVFIFDFWYGPAVLSVRPSTRIRRLENSRVQVTRLAEPVIHFQENVVDVNYEILVQPKDGRPLERVNETHRMRYFFVPELSYMLRQAGFEEPFCEGWLGEPLGAESWAGVAATVRKVGS